MLLTATRIHDGNNWLPDGTVIEVAEDGSIVAIHTNGVEGDVQHHDGIITPGFVNAHCHMELSHMKGKIPEHTGLIPFLMQVNGGRNDFDEAQKVNAGQQAYDYMLQQGIVAVGDIANTADTLDLRGQHRMHVHTFVESIGFSVEPQKRFDYAMAVYHALEAQPQEDKLLRQSIVPHAPYSVSEQLFGIIDEFDKNALISIHNQETEAEGEYYIQKTGDVKKLLGSIGIDDGFFQPSGKSSLQTYGEWLSPGHPLILVHNTFSAVDDVQYAQQRYPRLYWCLCPNANKYIENRLPDIPMLMEQGVNICIGTDSLSSNHKLSVLSELQTIKEAYPQIEWEYLFRWATSNGAKALQMDEVIGSIEVGKKPGLNLIKDNVVSILV